MFITFKCINFCRSKIVPYRWYVQAIVRKNINLNLKVLKSVFEEPVQFSVRYSRFK